MDTIDLKDRKILYELDYNCRQSNTHIGKKVGLKKDVVSYRINKLEKEGIIKNYYTVIDAYKLGYYLFRYYINFQYVTPDLRKEIVEFFADYKKTCTVGHSAGKYDLILVIWVDNLNEFHQFWSKALDNYGDYFESRLFSLYIYGLGFRQSFLLNNNRAEDRNHIEIFGAGERAKIDNIDLKLLNELSLNARANLLSLANVINCSSQTVNYRIKRLQKNGVIQSFRVNLDFSKFGLKRYKADIYLKEYKQRKSIIAYIKNNPSLIYISTSTGLSDLEFEVVVESPEKLIEIIEDINIHFPNSIRNYSFYGNLKVLKESFLPTK